VIVCVHGRSDYLLFLAQFKKNLLFEADNILYINDYDSYYFQRQNNAFQVLKHVLMLLTSALTIHFLKKFTEIDQCYLTTYTMILCVKVKLMKIN